MSDQRPPVLIAGAGPVGLVLACELRRAGVRIRLVDKLSEPSPLSKAIAVHARTLEHLDRLGVAERLVGLGVKATAMRLVEGRRELGSIDLTGIESRFPFALCVPQTDTEATLTRRLGELGGEIERGVELVALEQTEDGVTATLRRQDGDERVQCTHLVGCDGGHSTVRKLVGEQLAGSFKGTWFLLADCDAEHDLEDASMMTFLHPEGVLAYFPLDGARCRLIAQVGEERPEGEAPTLEETAEIVTTRTGGRVKISDPRWLAYFEIRHGQVASYRVGNVFLAGDAAHVHSPAGGQGMNTGIQDAVNLAWKLGLSWHGAAGPELLASYQAERHPVGEHVIRFSTALIDAGTVTSSVVRALRRWFLSALLGRSPVQGRLSKDVTEVQVSYRRSPLVGGAPHRPAGSLDALHPGDFAPEVEGVSADERSIHLGELFQPARHTALFVARSSSDECGRAAESLRRSFGAHVATVLVAPAAVADDRFDRVAIDPQAGCADRYGAAEAMLALVRPDGYLAFLGTPGDLELAERTLARAIG
jgi:2-polyprenyl-6-methoxyphenol hydroxylase-like FAD-dependent oxidoreductase